MSAPDSTVFCYADPQRCPGCRGPIGIGDPACVGCGLSLAGADAADLFTALSHADRLVARLRATPGTPAAPPAAASEAVTEPVAAGSPTSGASRPVGGWRPGAASVPRVLLGLGALCVLVAALVFLAVTWSLLGVGGRTAVLVGLTGVAYGAAAWSARTGLRTAAESLSVVALGLAVFDLAGARASGWFGQPDVASFGAGVGVVAAVAACVVAVRLGTRSGRPLVAPQVAAWGGAAAVAVALPAASVADGELLLVVSVALLSGAATAAVAARLRVAASGFAGVWMCAWLALFGAGLVRAVAHPTLGQLWGGGHGWLLLSSAVFPAVAVPVTRLPRLVRRPAATVALVVVAVALLVPAWAAGGTWSVAATAALSAAAAGGGWLSRRAAGPLLTVAAGAWLWPAAAAGVLAAAASGRVLEVLAEPGFVPASAVLSGPTAPDLVGAVWLLPVGVLLTCWVVLTAARTFRPVDRVAWGLFDPAALVAVLGVTAAATVALGPVPVWLPAAVLSVTAVALVGSFLRTQVGTWLVAVVPVTALAVLTALAAAGLAVVVLAGVAVAAVLVNVRGRTPAGAGPAGAVAVGSAVGSVWVAGVGGSADLPLLAGLLLAAAGLLGVVAGRSPVRWWSGGVRGRVGVEAGVLLVAGPVAVAGVAAAGVAERAWWAAVYLTVAGVAAVAVALLVPGRHRLAPVGTGLLLAASWVRLVEAGVVAPEAYTVPAAVLLAGAGVYRMLRDPAARSVRVLGSALVLGLGPSLLWAVAEPVSARALLLGGLALALVTAGAALRWSAPLLAGAAVAAVLVARHAVPWLDAAVPRWLLIGAAGLLLIVLGVTWERALLRLRAARVRVRALR